jgi:hypothetical protein
MLIERLLRAHRGRRHFAAANLATAMFTIILSGCSARGSGSATSDVTLSGTECEEFLAAYGQCLESLGSTQVAHARLAQTRAALTAEMQQGDAARAEVRQKCVVSLSQVQTSCGRPALARSSSRQGATP